MSTSSPKKVLFVLTSMPVGGAETLLVNLLRSFDPTRVEAQVCCLKDKGPLGERISDEFTVHANFLSNKYDLRVVLRLWKLMRAEQYDAVITVSCGDNMFWGRIAAHLAGVPVIASALHSTGWPDGIGRLNRMLTPITDAFIAVAEAHGQFLREFEKLPANKVFVVPNGVDTQRYKPSLQPRKKVRKELGIADTTPLACIVAALRPEKNHKRFLRIASQVKSELVSNSEYLIVGDGPIRAELEDYCRELGIENAIHFLGSRSDIDQILPACDAFMLTSDNEANPVSIMEAMACGLPVIAPDVGSISEIVTHEETGFVISKEDEAQFAEALGRLFQFTDTATSMGSAGRSRIQKVGSLQSMVDGYQQLIEQNPETSPQSVTQRLGWPVRLGWRAQKTT